MIYALVFAVLFGPLTLFVAVAMVYDAGRRAEHRWWVEYLEIDEGEEC
jgi:hypothetical protein